MRSLLLLLSLSLWALVPTRAQSAQRPKAAARTYFDQAHGEASASIADIGPRLSYTLDLVRGATTTESLRGSQLVYFRAPNGTFTESEKAAIVAHSNSGGSLLLVLDEEKRPWQNRHQRHPRSLGMKLSGDTPRIHGTTDIQQMAWWCQTRE